MAEERDLDMLLSQMAAWVHPEIFVFCCLHDFHLPQVLEPVATFREAEGLTAIVPKRQAEALGLDYRFESTMITLSVHSSLDSVGFLARISEAVAAVGIPCNVVSAYCHDHLFVPTAKASDTIAVLQALSAPFVDP